jgi:hypothetical protein
MSSSLLNEAGADSRVAETHRGALARLGRTATALGHRHVTVRLFSLLAQADNILA